jgi:hypothetical protein
MSNFQQSLQNLLQEGLDHKIISHKELVYAACQVVRAVLHLIPEGENMPRIAIETTERWYRGEATSEEVRQAANAAANAAYAAYYAANAADAASYAANAATYAVYAAYYAANAADAASYAANAATYAADAASYAADNLLEKQAEMKKLLLSHLPKLQKWKVFL